VHAFYFRALSPAVLQVCKDNHLAHAHDLTVALDDENLSSFSPCRGHRRYVPFGVARVVIGIPERARDKNFYRHRQVVVSQWANNRIHSSSFPC